MFDRAEPPAYRRNAMFAALHSGFARGAARVAMAAFTALAAAPAAHGAAASAIPLRPSGPPELVIYQDDFAYVRAPHRATFAAGENEVSLAGVPQRLDSTSVRLEGAGLDVRRQAFRYDLWDGDKVFRRYLGDSISFRWMNRTARGVLEGMDGDELFIRRADSTEGLMLLRRSQIQELEFPSHDGPWSLATRPSLTWRVRADRAGERAVTLAYLTRGIGWTTEYVATVADGDRALSLSGWASIRNESGASFAGGSVSLVAGEVHRANAPPDRGGAAVGEPSAPAPPSPLDLFAYHLYPIPDPVDLPAWGTLQVPIVTAANVACRRVYRYDGARDGAKVRAQLLFENAKGSGLGQPLPAGRVRVFAADPSGATTLVGEDAIEHTPVGAPVRLLCGIAFDLTGERTRVGHTRVARNVTEDRYRIRLRNAGAKDAAVTVAETLYGAWEITERSGDYRAVSSEEIEFDAKVPARGETTITYTVRYSY